MGVRLIILMAMGLGALYMMHLLAQDYNKIRQPVAAATKALTSASGTLIQWQQSRTRGKRNIENITNDETKNNATIHSENINGKKNQITTDKIIIQATPKIDWKRILSRDPFECLLSLICQLMAGAESNSYEAVMLMDYLETTLLVAPAKIGRAFSMGLAFRGASERCYDEFPFCMYSANTMMRVLKWFADSGHDN